jgi:class 3 adenylate cyclase
MYQRENGATAMKKPTILVSILTIFITLLLLVGFTVAIINYRIGHTLSLSLTKTLMTTANDGVEYKIYSFLRPLNTETKLSAQLIKNKVVDPNDTDKFKTFLLGLLYDHDDFSSAHWSTPRGDFASVERSGENRFTYQVINCQTPQQQQSTIAASQPCINTVNTIDQEGNNLTQPTITPTSFDPRQRPWYQQALAKKHYILSDAYPFFQHPYLGITAVHPVYSDAHQQQLLGMISIDMRLQELSDFIASLQITPNAEIFVFEKSKDYNKSSHGDAEDSFSIIASPMLPKTIPHANATASIATATTNGNSSSSQDPTQNQNSLQPQNQSQSQTQTEPQPRTQPQLQAQLQPQPQAQPQLSLKVSDYTKPWVLASLQKYRENPKQNFFFFGFEKGKYVAFYDIIESLGNSAEWYAAIAIPTSDLTKLLIQALTISISAIAAILLLAIIASIIFSRTLSQSMIRLTNKASMIQNLELTGVTPDRPSYIKEIFYLQNAFNSMKQSLTSFIRYVPFALVKKLISSGDIAHVSGETKTITFLFADLEGFTSLAETIAPQALMKYISTYFEAMTKTIFKHHGTLDKYIGDAIMALWGAPNEDSKQAFNACQCAVEMLDILAILNDKWRQSQQPTLRVRIGINTGAAVIGNMGSEDRLNYTAIGDNVNIASRLENINKLYGSTIIVSEFTYQIVKNNYQFRLLDYVAVHGKKQAIHIYELITPHHPLSQHQIDIKDYNKSFSAAFMAYQNGQWEQATALFKELAILCPDDYLAKLFIERCAQLKAKCDNDGNVKNWNGIWYIQ